MNNNTWSHALARVLVRPLVGSKVRPNHITWLRLVTGVVACALLTRDAPAARLWAGLFWLVSAFLDRADGELARIGEMQTPEGHLFDYHADVLINSGFFFCAGLGLQHSWLGAWAVPLGVIAGAAMVICCWLSELYEALAGPGIRTYEGGWGFQPDDALYLLSMLIWLDWLAPVVLASSVVTSGFAIVVFARYLALKGRRGQGEARRSKGAQIELSKSDA